MKHIGSLLVVLTAVTSSNPHTGSSATATSGQSSLAFAGSVPTENRDSGVEESTETPLLPESDPNADIPSLKIGESFQMDYLGPVIINSDGTTRRIDNWAEMSEKEKEVAWRRVKERNEERRQKLLEKEQKEAMQQRSSDKEDL